MAVVVFKIVYEVRCSEQMCDWSDFGHWDDVAEVLTEHRRLEHRYSGDWTVSPRALRHSVRRLT